MIPIRLPDDSKDLLRVPMEHDPYKIQLTRSPVQTADSQVELQPKKPRKLQLQQKHKQMFQKAAKEQWDKGSRKNTADMVRFLKSRLKSVVGHEYNDEVVRRWIYKANPDYEPGITGQKKGRKK
jgi:hypothetical protein